MKKLVLILVLSSCLLSCQQNPKVDNISLFYDKVGSIEIGLKAENQYNHSQIQLIDSCTVIALDRNFQKLDIISFCDSSFKQSVIFADDGPNRVYPVSSFYYHTADSIFLYSSDASTFQLINSQSEILNKWRLDDNKYPKGISDSIIGSDNYFYPLSVTSSGMFYYPFIYDAIKGELLIQVIPNSELIGFGDRKTIYNAPIIGNLKLETGFFENFQGRWPELFKRNETPNNPFVHLCFNQKNADVILTYFNSDLVFSTEKNRFFNARSNFFKEKYTLFSIAEGTEYTTEQELDAYHQDEGYTNLVYDHYKKLYYRVAKHHLERGHRMESNWSIIVFNEQFKVLGEVLMPKAVYNYLQILPTPKGLLISKENPYSPTNNEEEYAFDLIEINL